MTMTSAMPTKTEGDTWIEVHMSRKGNSTIWYVVFVVNLMLGGNIFVLCTYYVCSFKVGRGVIAKRTQSA